MRCGIASPEQFGFGWNHEIQRPMADDMVRNSVCAQCISLCIPTRRLSLIMNVLISCSWKRNIEYGDTDPSADGALVI